MSNSPLVSYVKISPHRTSPRNAPIDTITIHHMAGNLSVESCGNVFQNRQASSNYGIGTDGRVGMYVEEKDRSWASANAPNDHRAVTIEVANDGGAPDWHVSDTALIKCVELCADICRRNGIERLNYTGDTSGNLTMHKWFYPTTCPGPYLESRFPGIAQEVNKRLGAAEPVYTQTDFVRQVQSLTGSAVDGIPGPETLGNTPTVSRYSNDTHPVVAPIQRWLGALGYTQAGEADGIAGAKFEAALKAFQADHDCVADGEATAKMKTWRALLGMA